MRLYKTSKTVLSFSGHAAEFLNGITSNVVSAPRNAFLTMHGKVVATFDQARAGDDEIWAVLESAFVEKVRSHIERFVALSGVSVEEKPHNVYFNLDCDYMRSDNEHVILQKAGELIITASDLDAPVGAEEFTLFRLRHNIPLLGVDYIDDFILNVSPDEFTSFTKGCYLGQEPVSKVHNRAKPTWKLAVKFEDECAPDEAAKMTSRSVDPDSGRAFGFVFARNA